MFLCVCCAETTFASLYGVSGKCGYDNGQTIDKSSDKDFPDHQWLSQFMVTSKADAVLVEGTLSTGRYIAAKCLI